MPLVITPSEEERRAVVEAIRRVEKNDPKDPTLAKRARRGSLKLNLATVAIESNVARHRIESLYAEQADYIASRQPAPDEAVPLAHQRDEARKAKAEAERKLERAQAYCFRILERMNQINSDRKLLQERIDDLEQQISGECPQDDIIGTDLVIGTPPVPKPPKRKNRPSTAAPA